MVDHLLYLLLVLSVSSAKVLFGVQTDDRGIGSSFASSMAYDEEMSRLYITGTTNGPFFDQNRNNRSHTYGCFLGILQMPVRETDTEPRWLKRERVDDDFEAGESSCTDIYISRTPSFQRHIYLLGHTTMEGETRGFLRDLNWAAETKASYWMGNFSVQYPISFASLEGEPDFIVAQIVSDTNDTHPLFEVWNETLGNVDVDISAAGGYFPPRLGSNFAASIDRLSVLHDSTETASFHNLWKSHFSITGSSIQLSMVDWVSPNLVVLVGSTKGAVMFSELGSLKEGTEMDGFVVTMNPSTGDTLKHHFINFLHRKDKVLGMCHHLGGGEVSLYIVGMTQREESHAYDAFVAKINAITLDQQWVTRFNATSGEGDTPASSIPQVHALSCAVDASGSFVFVAGNVLGGGVVMSDGAGQPTSSYGDDDIFLAKVKTRDGTQGFIEQIGTRSSDLLANGKGILIDRDGNLILLANTRGTHYKSLENDSITSDVVVFSVDSVTGNFFVPETFHTAAPTVEPAVAPEVTFPATTEYPKSPFENSGDTISEPNPQIDYNRPKKEADLESNRSRERSNESKFAPSEETQNHSPYTSEPEIQETEKSVDMGLILGLLAVFNAFLVGILFLFHVIRQSHERDNSNTLLADCISESSESSVHGSQSCPSYSKESSTSFDARSSHTENLQVHSKDFTSGWWVIGRRENISRRTNSGENDIISLESSRFLSSEYLDDGFLESEPESKKHPLVPSEDLSQFSRLTRSDMS